MIEVREQFNVTLSRLNDDLLDEDSSLKVGDLVKVSEKVSFYLSPSFIGVIIEIIDFKSCKVLWNNSDNLFKDAARLAINDLIERSLIQVEPMPSGAALKYYLSGNE